MSEKCLFSAPFSFLAPDFQERYRKFIPTTFREIWDRDGLFLDDQVVAWVVNPGQRFLVDEIALDNYPNLRVLITPSTGTNHINMDACSKRGIPVFGLLDNRECLNTITASAEFSFLLLLNTLRRLDIAVSEVSVGRWRHREDELRGNELSGKLVGIVGFGRIGKKLARYNSAFDADVVYHDPYVEDDSYPNIALETLFERSDIVCISCTLNSETMGLIDKSLLVRLKKNACLINTSRGEIIVEDDLATVLAERPDLRVGLDVVAGEVTNTQFDSPLLKFHRQGRIVITPHIAGATVESQTKAALCALELLKQHENKN